jgi:hypothetical protein
MSVGRLDEQGDLSAFKYNFCVGDLRAVKGKSKMSRKQQGAEKRPCFCLAFDRTSFLCRMVTACMAMVSFKDDETR